MMQWNALGFSDNPFNTDPIRQATLDLYVGRDKSVATCKNVLAEKNVLLIVEGARGIGTTSFGNYLRFNSQAQKKYFTPSNEIRVGAGWNIETLLAVVVGNIVRELDIFQSELVANNKKFQDAKALTMRIAETYRSFGIDALGFGLSYGKNAGIASQPSIVPAAILGHHLEDLANLVQSLGYEFGILLQLNNLDVGAIHEAKHLKYLFNELRDYIQTDIVSWMLVGDVGLRRFIAQQVDRLDDIVSYEVKIDALSEQEFLNLVNQRVSFYKTHKNAEMPVDQEVFLHLFKITKGRLRYVFGLLKRLLNELSVGDLTDRLTLDIAKPMVTKLAQERIAQYDVTPKELSLLQMIVKTGHGNASKLSVELGQSRQAVSRALVNLLEIKLLTVQQSGRDRTYYPVLEAEIAYSSEE
ncbi:MarR family transcriptional regulator [Cysteiniphilum halobium]|uniref:MarR family transcriptional regulator n=1 Tax=Cysteiniphilum halobium TaxID=2219059 RepID=UPI0013C33567|nr:helix-turn-helix domain-containing protein [Cysteiniphilum halobium]